MKKSTLNILAALLTTFFFLHNSYAQTCEIGQVNVDVLPCDESGMFYVVLNFGYANVGNEGFHVQGNGNNYGNFSYENLPIEIGPLEGNGTTVYEFVVIDNQFADCSNWTAIDPVDCTGGGDCSIWEVTAVPTDCNDDGFFWVVLDFEYQNVGDQGFTVHGNGNNYGTFEYENLPVEIGPLAGDGVTVYEFGVTDVQFEGCSNWTVIDPVDCNGSGDCHIWEVVVDDHPCQEGYFYVYLDFNYENVSGEGFTLMVNNDLYGNFSYEDLPLLEVGPFLGDGTTVYVFHVFDQVYGDCGAYREFGPINCGGGGNCEIGMLNIDVLDCVEGMFNVILDFDYANVGDQGFKVWVNEDLYGHFWYEDLPLNLGPFVGDGTTVYHFLVRDVAHPDCASDRSIDPVDCSGGGDCHIWDLVPTILPCNDDGLFMVLLNFNHANVGEEGFTVYINEVDQGEYAYEDVPVEVGPLEGDGTTVYNITVRDDQYEGCYDETAFAVDCGGMPLLANMTSEVTSCQEDVFYIEIDFDPEYQGDSGFIIMSNIGGQGIYSYESLPLTLGPFTTDGITDYYFIVQDVENGMAGNWRSLTAFTCQNLGVDEDANDPVLAVYPNPAFGSVNFRNSGQEAVRIWVSGFNGIKVINFDIQPGQVIPVDYLKPGMYLYRANIDGNAVGGKFILQQK